MRLTDIPETWDLVIIGGGIVGAGILREASRTGLQVLLLEQKDFAWGTSSRSSKLIHGGLRYLKERKFRLTKISVEEREYLLKNAPGLVESLGFLLPVYEHQSPGKHTLKIGLSLYDLMARERQHRFLDAESLAAKLPIIKKQGLKGGFQYYDAQVDDARMVLRLIKESIDSGAYALNYTAASEILRNSDGNVTALIATDVETHVHRTLKTPAIINATGCWAEKFHPASKSKRRLRPLRGSHLVFPTTKLPIGHGFGFFHPADNRSLFIVPWEGAILVGTTDLDHQQDLNIEPTVSDVEVAYLMEAVNAIFPRLDISLNDCLSSFAGIRPVLSAKDRLPSEESREHVIWANKGLVTATGGKLTTFRRLTWGALKAIKTFIPQAKIPDRNASIFTMVPDKPPKAYGLTDQIWKRLYGRYGQNAQELVQTAKAKDLTIIPGTHTLWAELPYAARHEQVRHLDDLLLRRVRMGLLTPFGGQRYLKRIKKLCKKMLPWDRRRWKTEIARYKALWLSAHAPPPLPVTRMRQKRGLLSKLRDRFQLGPF